MVRLMSSKNIDRKNYRQKGGGYPPCKWPIFILDPTREQAWVIELVAQRLAVQEFQIQNLPGANYYEQMLLSISRTIAYIMYSTDK